MENTSKESAQKTALHKEDWRSWQTVFFVLVLYLLLGVNYTQFSVLYGYITEYFESNKAITGWIGSIQRGTTLILGKWEGDGGEFVAGGSRWA